MSGGIEADLALADGVVRIPDGKTRADRRTTPLFPPIEEALVELKALRLPADRDAVVFGIATGGKENDANVRNRWLEKWRSVPPPMPNLLTAWIGDVPDACGCGQEGGSLAEEHASGVGRGHGLVRNAGEGGTIEWT